MALLGEERKRKILDVLDIKGRVKVNELAADLKVSTETIRRYLSELEQQNLLKKVYGGAVSLSNPNEELPHFKREILNAEEKRRIGKIAANHVHDNDIIAIDEGSTTLQLIRYIKTKKNLTVYTNSFPAAFALMDFAEKGEFDGKVVFIGGVVNSRHKRVSGTQSEKVVESFYFDKAFLSAEGVSLQYGITCYDPEKGMLTRKLLEQAKTAYVLADHSKINVRSHYKVADASAVDAVFTDKPAPEAWRERLDSAGIGWFVG